MEQNLCGITDDLIRNTLEGFNPIAHALNELCTGSQFTIRGYRYSDIEWSPLNPQVLPEKDILEKVITSTIEQKILYNSYGPNRRNNYPSISEQLDMLYWDSVNGSNTWIDTITKIKTTYPKPT